MEDNKRLELLTEIAGGHNVVEVFALLSQKYSDMDSYDKKRYRDFVKLFKKLNPDRSEDIEVLKRFML